MSSYRFAPLVVSLVFGPLALHGAASSGGTRDVALTDGGGVDAAPSDAKTTTADAKIVEQGNGTCKRSFTMGKVNWGATNPSCYVNEQVSNRTSDVEYECKTGGKAEITFGTQTFTGTIKGNTVDVTNIDQFPFSGCTWESTQRIFGDLSTGKIDYSYREKPLTSCPNTYPCVADAKFTVSATAEEEIK